jgi:hypothetical protein
LSDVIDTLLWAKIINSKELVKLTVKICNGLSTQVLFCCCFKQGKQRTRTKPVTFYV